MSRLFQNKVVILGVLTGILIMIALNFYSIYRMTGCHHCAFWFGFPLPFYVSYMTNCELSSEISFGCYTGEISWFGTIANLLISVIFSFVIGAVFKMIWGKFTTKRLT